MFKACFGNPKNDTKDSGSIRVLDCEMLFNTKMTQVLHLTSLTLIYFTYPSPP